MHIVKLELFTYRSYVFLSFYMKKKKIEKNIRSNINSVIMDYHKTYWEIRIYI